MNCNKAQELIDLRVHDPGLRDWAELDAHLAQCAKCATHFAELQRTRELLAELRADAPTNEEVETMLTAVTSANGGEIMAIRESSGTWRLVARFTAACVGIAAVLVVALGLGSLRYDRDSFVYNLLPTLSAERGRAQYEISGPDESQLHAGLSVPCGTGGSVAEDQAWDSDADGLAEDAEYLGRTLRRAQVATRSSDAARGGSGGIAGEAYLTYGVPESGQDAAGKVQADAGFRGFAREIDYGNQTTAQSAGGSGGGRAKLPQRLDSKPDEPPADRIMLGTEFVPAAPPPALPFPGNAVDTEERETDVYEAHFLDGEALAAVVRGPIADEENQDSDSNATQTGRSGARFFGYSDTQAAEPEAQVESAALLTEGDGVAFQGPALAAAAQPEPARPPARTPREPVERRPEPVPQRPAPKIIKTGQVTVEVERFDETVERVNTIVAQTGAFIADASTEEQTGGALIGRVVIRVDPERFEELFAALKTLGRVESENAQAADVTEQYVDLEARIHSLQITEERLHELVKSKSIIDKVSSVLEVERELTRVRSQIEQLQGKLRVMADRIGRSTITLTLREPARTVPSASLSIEVPLLQEAADALAARLTELNGRLVSGKTSKHDNGTMRGTYQLEISVARFTELLGALEGLGRVEDRQVRDHQFGDANEPWAQRVRCQVSLVLFERSRALPSGWVHLEVEELAPALKKLEELLPAVEAALVANESTRQEDGSLVADVQVRVPAGKFASLLDTLPAVGRTTSRNTSGEVGSIVGGAAHVPCTLALKLRERPREVPRGGMTIEVESFENARTQLSTLVTEKTLQVLGSASDQRTDGTWVGGFRLGIKAEAMEGVVTRLESLGRVKARRISGLGLGDLSRMDPEAMGVLELTLAEPATIQPGPEHAGGTIRGKLRDALTGLYTSLGYILYGLIVLAPWVLIVLLIGWLLMRARRRFKRAQ